MFLKMGYLLIKKGEAHDLSEHKSGEAQDLRGKYGHGSSCSNGFANGTSNGTNGALMNGHGTSNGNTANDGKNKSH
jgi:hypothetical protein